MMKLSLYNLLVLSIVIFLTPAYHGAEIIGGHVVKPHSKPYMVSLQKSVWGNMYTHFCGGALIRPNWVLSAAHCEKHGKVDTDQFLQAVLGVDSLLRDEKSKQKLRIKRQIPHPKFSNKTMENDIMLLELESDAKINKFVNVLKLPKEAITDVKPGTTCTVAGWGKTRRRYFSDTLQEVELLVIDRKTCNSVNYYNYRPKITQDMICVGDSKGRGDSCQGDSGGPLICNNKYTGIVSFGKGCAIPHKPGVYTLITKKYLYWIQSTIGVTAEELY